MLTKKCFFCHFGWFLTVRHFNICITRKFFLLKIQKQGFHTWKNPKNHKNIKIPINKNWSYSFNEDVVIHQRTLMFSKIIGSGMTLWWSDTPQCKHQISILFQTYPVHCLKKYWCHKLKFPDQGQWGFMFTWQGCFTSVSFGHMQCSVCSVHSKVCIVQCAVFSMLFAVYIEVYQTTTKLVRNQ